MTNSLPSNGVKWSARVSTVLRRSSILLGVAIARPTIPSGSDKDSDTRSLRRSTPDTSIGAIVPPAPTISNPVHKANAALRRISSLRSVPSSPGSETDSDTYSHRSSTSWTSIGASSPPTPTVPTALEEATIKETLGSSSFAQSTTTNPTEGLSTAEAEEQHSPTGCGSETDSDTHSLRSNTSWTTIAPPTPTVSTAREVVSMQGPSALAQLTTTNLYAEAGEQTGPDEYVPPPIFDSNRVNSGASKLVEEAPTWVDATSSSRSTEEIRGPRSALNSYSTGSSDASDKETSSAGQCVGIAESKEISTPIDSAENSYSTKPESSAIPASMFSNAQNMTIYGGSYHLNVYPPHRGGSPNLANTHAPWDRWAGTATDNNDVATIPKTGRNLRVSLPTLVVSDELLGKHFECSTFTSDDFFCLSRNWILRNRRP